VEILDIPNEISSDRAVTATSILHGSWGIKGNSNTGLTDLWNFLKSLDGLSRVNACGCYYTDSPNWSDLFETSCVNTTTRFLTYMAGQEENTNLEFYYNLDAVLHNNQSSDEEKSRVNLLVKEAFEALPTPTASAEE